MYKKVLPVLASLLVAFVGANAQSPSAKLFDLLGKELNTAQLEKLIIDNKFTAHPSGFANATKAPSSKALIDSLRPFNESIYSLFIPGNYKGITKVQLVYRHVQEVTVFFTDSSLSAFVYSRYGIEPTDVLMETALKNKHGVTVIYTSRNTKTTSINWKDDDFNYSIVYKLDTLTNTQCPDFFNVAHRHTDLSTLQRKRTALWADSIEGKYGASPHIAVFNTLYAKVGKPISKSDVREIQTKVQFNECLVKAHNSEADRSKTFAPAVLLDSVFTHYTDYSYNLRGDKQFGMGVRKDTLYEISFTSTTPYIAAAVQAIQLKARYAEMKKILTPLAKTNTYDKVIELKWQTPEKLKIELTYMQKQNDTLLTRVSIQMPHLPGYVRDKPVATDPNQVVLECQSGNCNNGYGKAKFKGTPFYYEGYFKDDLPHGTGKITFNAKAYCQGNFYKGDMDGEGMFDWGNGNKYIGGFKNGIPHGKCTYFEKASGYYEGPAVNGKLTCADCWRPKQSSSTPKYVNGNQWLLESVQRQQNERDKLIEYQNSDTWFQQYLKRNY